MADVIGLRTVAIDATGRAAIADGATQLVILGAGYDGRAWRMSELAGVRVFEVDHPATQRRSRSSLDSKVASLRQVHLSRSVHTGLLGRGNGHGHRW